MIERCTQCGEKVIYCRGHLKAGVPRDLFPEGGVPLRGELTEAQEAWLKGDRR